MKNLRRCSLEARLDLGTKNDKVRLTYEDLECVTIMPARMLQNSAVHLIDECVNCLELFPQDLRTNFRTKVEVSNLQYLVWTLVRTLVRTLMWHLQTLWTKKNFQNPNGIKLESKKFSKIPIDKIEGNIQNLFYRPAFFVCKSFLVENKRKFYLFINHYPIHLIKLFHFKIRYLLY